MKTENEIMLTCLGAAGTVTGSNHLLCTSELNLLANSKGEPGCALGYSYQNINEILKITSHE